MSEAEIYIANETIQRCVVCHAIIEPGGPFETTWCGQSCNFRARLLRKAILQAAGVFAYMALEQDLGLFGSPQAIPDLVRIEESDAYMAFVKEVLSDNFEGPLYLAFREALHREYGTLSAQWKFDEEHRQ